MLTGNGLDQHNGSKARAHAGFGKAYYRGGAQQMTGAFGIGWELVSLRGSNRVLTL
jgi:hypothetical protein